MMTKKLVYLGIVAVGIAAFLASWPSQLSSQQSTSVSIDNDDIGGVVTSAKGPEAGVWVIAETTDLPTRFARMVVTDDRGRYVLPDLPKANYNIWVRGYGLVDSPKVKATPGKNLNLKAVVAPNEAAAAKYYPAIYWYSMLKIPEASEFGGKGAIPAKITQSEWLNSMKNNGCIGCHQLGQLSTRTFPSEVPYPLGKFATSEEAWFRRIQSGQSGEQMFNQLVKDLGAAPFRYFADWTDRIAKGELPHAKPARPQGVERNIVVTTWDWLDDKHYLHDLIASDRRYPTVNAYGPLYGSTEYSTDIIPILDPVKHTHVNIVAPVRDANTPEALGPGHAASDKLMQPSPYWGDEKIWDTKANNHNGMFDQKGTGLVRGDGSRRRQSGLLQEGLRPSLGQGLPGGADEPPAHDARSQDAAVHVRRHLLRDASFAVRLRRQRDAVDQRRRAGGRLDQHQDVRRDGRCCEIAGLDAAHPRHQRQRQARRVRRAQPAGGSDQGQADRRGLLRRDAESGGRLDLGLISDLIRELSCGSFRDLIRRRRRSPRSTTCRCRALACAAPTSTARASCGYRWRAVTWAVSIGASAKVRSTGRRPPAITALKVGRFISTPVLDFKGIGENSAESSYYTWVDQHNTFGLGEDMPMSTGNLNDGLIAMKDGKMIVLRVPYPMGFYAKGFDGRIDDPKAGWKGRGLWTTSGDRAPWLKEGGKGSKPIVVQFQLRPDPLAK